VIVLEQRSESEIESCAGSKLPNIDMDSRLRKRELIATTSVSQKSKKQGLSTEVPSPEVGKSQHQNTPNEIRVRS
jgi:hypothetical protein